MLTRSWRKKSVKKEKIKALDQLDVIAQEKKLIEIYVAIVKEMAVKYGVAVEREEL